MHETAEIETLRGYLEEKLGVKAEKAAKYYIRLSARALLQDLSDLASSTFLEDLENVEDWLNDIHAVNPFCPEPEFFAFQRKGTDENLSTRVKQCTEEYLRRIGYEKTHEKWNLFESELYFKKEIGYCLVVFNFFPDGCIVAGMAEYVV